MANPGCGHYLGAMNEIDEARRRRFTKEIATYRKALESAKLLLEMRAADGDGPRPDVRDQFIAEMERSIANRERLIAAIDLDNFPRA